MITTKADKLLKSLIHAGLSLTEFTILATRILRIQHELKSDDNDRRLRDRLRQQEKQREENLYEQQIQQEEQRRKEGRKKLQELGYLSTDDTTHSKSNQNIENMQIYSTNKENQIKGDDLLVPYTKEMHLMRQKQRDCCLTFNIDFDLRRNQQTLESACRRAKRNIYELRAERFHRPEHRSVLSVETITLHNKLKEAIREINKMFDESKSDEDKRFLQELITYINQFEGDIDLLMCQMQYEPKVKETILFSPVTTDILDRMNLILHHVRTVAKKISTCEYPNENIEDEDNSNNLTNLPDKVNYIIKIKTNDEISSSLSEDANVTIKLYGTHNKSLDIRLLQSINKIKWQSGQIDLFNIELNYLGDLYAIELWHDSEYSSWKVDWIEIIDDAANVYRFPVDRLFDKHSDEKKSRFIIQRDVGPVNRLPTKPVKQTKSYKQIGFATYTVKVKTGKQPNKVTDSSVYIQMKGENGEFSDQLCSANSAYKSSVFEPDQLDTFYLVWPHLGKLESLNLSVKSEGNQPAWFCEYVIVEDSQTEEKYKFVVNQLLNGSNPDDQNLKKHITVHPENTNQQSKKEDKDQPGYLMKIKTGEKGLSDSSTNPSINVTLKGDKDKTETYTLKPTDPKRKLFQENQTDEFTIPLKHYVGPIKDLQLSSNDQTDNWFIENIVMRDIAQGKDYIFPTYKFLNKKDGTNKLIVQPLNERKPDYKVYTRTIASEMKGPDRSVKLLLQGTKGKQEVELNNPVSMKNTFQPGRKDEFYIENLKSLGDLQSIQIDVTHPNIKKLGLDYIEIKDLATNNSYKFNINRMLDEKHPKMTAKAELIPPSSFNPSSSKTSPSQFPSPNPSTSKANKTNFDQLTTNLPQGSKRPDQGSHISIKFEEGFEKENTDQSVADISEEKSLSETDRSIKKNNYQVKIKTINKEFLDKDTKLQIELIDENGKSISNQTEENLKKGKIDSLGIDTPKDFGKLKNIKLSLIGSKSKKKNLYQPDYIEIIDPNGNQIDRLDYTKDDLLNSEKNRFEITKPIKRNFSSDSREKARPQGTAPSTVTSTKPTVSPYTKLAEKLLNENNEDIQSLHDQTITSSISENLSKEMTSSVDKLPNRQIRPGDRVKNNLRKQLINQQSESSLHEADWYRQSIETNRDHRDDAKQIQLNDKQHVSQTKFDHQQANIIQNQYEENQKIKRRLSNENKINLLPKTSSSRSLKGNESVKPNNMVNTKARVDIDKLKENSIKNKREKFLHAQTLPISQKPDSDYSTLKNNAVSNKEQRKIKEISIRQIKQQTENDDKMDTRIARDVPSALEQQKSSKTSYLTSENEKSFDRFSHESNPNIPRLRLETKEPSSISVPPESRTRNDIPQRRSQSAISSRTTSNISTSSTKHNPSSYSSKSSVNSTHTENLSNQLSKTSTAKKISADLPPVSSRQNDFRDEQLAISDSSSSEHNILPNTQTRSAVTIHTKTTKSDSDFHPIKRIFDNHESEHSSESSKSLLSPGKTKTSGDNHRQNDTKMSPIKTSDISTIQKLNKSTFQSSQKYLGKETSEIQSAPRPASGKSRVDDTPVALEPKTSSMNNKREQENQDSISEDSHSYPDERLAPKISDISSITSSTDSQPAKFNEPSLNTSNTAQTFDTKHSVLSKKQSTYSNVSNKHFGMDHMSTVDEESEPSSKSDFHRIQSSVPRSDSHPKNIQNRFETTSKEPSLDVSYTEQNRIVSNVASDAKHYVSSKKQSTDSGLSNKRFDIDHTDTTHQKSELPSRSPSNRIKSSWSKADSYIKNTQNSIETKSKEPSINILKTDQHRILSNVASDAKYSVSSKKQSTDSDLSNKRFDIDHADSAHQKSELPSKSPSYRIKSPGSKDVESQIKNTQNMVETNSKEASVDKSYIEQSRIVSNVASDAKHYVSSKKQSTDSDLSNGRYEIGNADSTYKKSELPSRSASNRIKAPGTKADSQIKNTQNIVETKPKEPSDTKHSVLSKKKSTDSDLSNGRYEIGNADSTYKKSELPSRSSSNRIKAPGTKADSQIKNTQNIVETKPKEPSVDKSYIEQSRIVSNVASDAKYSVSSKKQSTDSDLSNKRFDIDHADSAYQKSELPSRSPSYRIKSPGSKADSQIKNTQNMVETKSKEPLLDKSYTEQSRIVSNVASDAKHSVLSKKRSTDSDLSNKRFDIDHADSAYQKSELRSRSPSNRIKAPGSKTVDSQIKKAQNMVETKSKEPSLDKSYTEQSRIVLNVAPEAKHSVLSKKRSTDSDLSNERYKIGNTDTAYQKSGLPSRSVSDRIKAPGSKADSQIKNTQNMVETNSKEPSVDKSYIEQSRIVSNVASDAKHYVSSKKQSTDSDLSNKGFDTNNMDPSYERSEPLSRSASNGVKSLLPISDSHLKTIPSWIETKSNTGQNRGVSNVSSIYSNLSNKGFYIDNMSTVSEESEPSSKDVSNRVVSSVYPSSSDPENIQNSVEKRLKESPFDVSDVAVNTKQSTYSSIYNKHVDTDYISTLHEKSEPYSIRPSNSVKSSVPTTDSQPKNIQNRFETKSKVSSTHSNVLPHQKIKTSSKERSLSNLLPRSSQGSNHHKKTINAKSIVRSVKSNTSIDYEFRVQTGNESQLDGTTESVSIELFNTKGQTLKIPLINSLNNSQPFQKGQLDVFHFNIPNNFHPIKKIKLSLSKTINDPLHILYCELQERQTMNTFHFPIEKWLGEKNTYHVEMYINNSLI